MARTPLLLPPVTNGIAVATELRSTYGRVGCLSMYLHLNYTNNSDAMEIDDDDILKGLAAGRSMDL